MDSKVGNTRKSILFLLGILSYLSVCCLFIVVFPSYVSISLRNVSGLLIGAFLGLVFELLTIFLEKFFKPLCNLKILLERLVKDVPPYLIYPFAIIGAVTEEFVFRGLILAILLPLGVLLSVLISGLLFGFLHGMFGRLKAWSVFATLFGILAGLVTIASGDLGPAVAAHVTANVFAMVYLRRRSQVRRC